MITPGSEPQQPLVDFVERRLRRIWGLSFSEAFRRPVDLAQRSLYVEGWAIFEKTSLPGFEGRVAEFEPMRALRVKFPNARFFRQKGPCDMSGEERR